jgi:hypothetical protein
MSPKTEPLIAQLMALVDGNQAREPFSQTIDSAIMKHIALFVAAAAAASIFQRGRSTI